MPIDRRSLLACGAILPLVGMRSRIASAAEQADYTLRIANGLAELAPDHILSTTLYNGQFPGALLRFKERQRTVVDVYNDTDTPELVHWHSQMILSDFDGSAEAGTPYVPPHGMRRISFVPKPAGFRFYHTHVVAGDKPTTGVIKDVVMLGGYQEVEFDFVADNPGMMLFHYHQQLHMDFGLMALFDYA